MIAVSQPGLRDVHPEQGRQRSIEVEQRVNDPASAGRVALPSMALHAVRQNGRLIDFVWDSASTAAVILLHCNPIALRGRSMSELPETVPPGQPTLFERYRHILERGKPQSFAHVHWVAGRQEVVIHRVICERHGVVVTLTNLSANRRAQASRLRGEKRD